MKNISYNFLSSITWAYDKSVSSSVSFALLISIGISALTFVLSKEITASIILGSAVFIVSVFKSIRDNRYYITLLNINEGNTYVEFWDKDEKKSIDGSFSDFKFKKENGIDRTPNPYLAVYFKGHLMIKQFVQNDEWDINRINEIVELTSDK